MAFKLSIFPEAQRDLENGVPISRVAVKLKSLPQYESIPLKQLKNDLFNYNTYLMAENSIRPLAEDFVFYELSAILDENTCPICRKMNGKILKISERQAGVNFPPLCDHCRCTWLPHVEDWDKWMDEYEKKHSKEGKNRRRIFNLFKRK
ncbi:MAG: minor capsid protein [Anaerovoracaceae bacterium]